MHEVRITVPKGRGTEIAQIGLKAGLNRVTVSGGHIYGPNYDVEIVSAEVSTPLAKAFVDALSSAGALVVTHASYAFLGLGREDVRRLFYRRTSQTSGGNARE